MKTLSEILWIEHRTELKKFIQSKVKCRDETNDLLQDVFIKMHTNLHRLKDKQKVRPWLYQITRNTINDYFRKKKFTASTDELQLEEEKPEVSVNEKFAACMHPHINKLPAIYKEALTKTEFLNYSQQQLAGELGISYSGAKSRVQRARELLKSYFKQCCDVVADKYGNVLNFETKHNCNMCN